MIQLKDTVFVAASEIAEVIINELSGSITVRMKSGVGHYVPNDYGQSCYSTAKRIVSEIDLETKSCSS